MQLPDSTDPEITDQNPNDNDANSTAETAAVDSNNADENNNESNGRCSTDEDLVLDVSGKRVEFSILGDSKDAFDGLYLYKNVFNLIPKSIGTFRRLRNLKFFGNEIDLFPAEVGGLVGLECLQVKVSPPGFNSMSLSKLKGLKELDLSRVPLRSSVLTLLSEISGLRNLTKLSVCYFSIRYLPPEIGCLKNLKYLDLSFNKIKSLPVEISYLNDLISLKVANNKLVELPSGLSSLQRLENLDLSNNRLTSLGSLDLSLMHNLQTLNLQYNKLLSGFQIPSWVRCNLEGNGKGSSSEDLTSSVEMDVYETTDQDNSASVSYNGSHKTSSGIVTVPLGNGRCFASRRSSKRWKRRHYLQQRARQERLNNSRKWKGEEHAEVFIVKASEEAPSDNDVLASDTGVEVVSELIGKDDKQLLLSEAKDEKTSSIRHDDDTLTYKKGLNVKNSTSVGHESRSKGSEDECSQLDASLALAREGAIEQDEGSSSEVSNSNYKSKRHSDRDLNNPKPCKSRKPTDYYSNLSQKYSITSFCGTEDYLPDGFYDAGRDRPFMPLSSYEQIYHLDSREVILVDRERDEQLDAIALSAKALVFHLKHLNGLAKDKERVPVDNFQIASLLALFVSDHFGGSDKSDIVERTRKAVSGSNYKKPFVCTCSTGNGDSASASNKTLDTVEDVFSELCERSLQSIKSRRNSIVVPIGTLQFGVCRHRALLMKYLCDRMEAPVPCELIRGYLDFMPHAWNIIPLKRGDSWVRMLVDACHPHDIRDEMDPEYFCRYIPLSRTEVSLTSESIPVMSSFPSMATSDEIERVTSSSLIRCKFGSMDAAAKVRTLEINGASFDEVKKYEYSCLGEVRILGALKHACIVKMYGHQISSKWISVGEEEPERRILQSAILMEHIKGGSLKAHIKKLAKAGEKHVPVDFALCIAHDVASALAELHSKHIIHRDIKSENVLIDLDEKRDDGSPIVKLCDFDRAIPLRSFLHTCCIGHLGIPPPDVCVGTPLWMAPEVLRAMHKRNRYGLEVDIWSFGCLLYELLSLQVPYSGLSEMHVHERIQMGKRPRLPEELEALESSSKTAMTQSGTEAETETLRFLVDIFRQCTEENPIDRPTAEDLYHMLRGHKDDYENSSYKNI